MAWCVQLVGVHWLRFENNTYPLLVTRLADGGSLDKYLENLENKITYKQAIFWCHDLASAVSFIATRNIIHRDIAPRNLLLMKRTDADSKCSKLMLIDFGLSVQPTKNNFYSSTYYKVTDERMLPTNHLAPEVFKTQNHTLKGDVWQLGCCYYQIFTRLQEPEKHHIHSCWAQDIKNVRSKLPKPKAMPEQFFSKVLLDRVFVIDPAKRTTAFELVKTMDEVKAVETRNKYGIEDNMWNGELRIDDQYNWFRDNYYKIRCTVFLFLVLIFTAACLFYFMKCECDHGVPSDGFCVFGQEHCRTCSVGYDRFIHQDNKTVTCEFVEYVDIDVDESKVNQNVDEQLTPEPVFIIYTDDP